MNRKRIETLLEDLKDLIQEQQEEEPEDPVFGKVISSYSRKQAIEDGVLVDVSDTAKEAGIKYPTAVTSAVWSKIEVPKTAKTYQSTEGRLWDVLNMLSFAIRGGGSGKDRVNFRVKLGKKVENLYAVVGPGDDPSPTITIMEIGED